MEYRSRSGEDMPRKQLISAECNGNQYYVRHLIILVFVRDWKSCFFQHVFQLLYFGIKVPVPANMHDIFENLPMEYSHLYLALEGKLAAVICIEDPLRKEAKQVIRDLKKVGLKKVVMIGDGINDSLALSSADVVGGIIPPTTSALLHNTSTIAISLRSMGNLLEDSEETI